MVGAVAALAAAPAAIAEAQLSRASIADGQVFEISPFSLGLTFSSPVSLTSAVLRDQNGQDWPVDLATANAVSHRVTIGLPVLVPHR
jgi:methionine-rich copper-binding protein CopC